MQLQAWIDGACSGNPGPGGYGIILVNSEQKIIAEISNYEPNTTNNRTELLAAIIAIKSAFEKHYTDSLAIYTDSNYVKNGITSWIANWKINNWQTASKQPVKNQDLWLELDTLNSKYNISWQWVKGHNNNLFNNLADKLARNAIIKCI